MCDGPKECERQRAYNVMMHALAETHRILKFDRRELLRRQQEIYRDCFSDRWVTPTDADITSVA
jgi:hypothetical protein